MRSLKIHQEKNKSGLCGKSGQRNRVQEIVGAAMSLYALGMWKRIAHVIALTPMLTLFFACSSDDPAPDKLQCSGEECDLACPVGSPDCQAECTKGADCDLDCNDATCDLDCGSKSECTADCTQVGGCDAQCEGQSSCAIDCTGAGGCDLGCAGGSECQIDCEENCGGGCTGNSDCHLACEQGCDVGCNGNARCDLTCKTNCFVCCKGSTDCQLNCTDSEVTECQASDGSMIYVCGRECPSADECRYGDTTATPDDTTPAALP